MLPIYLMMLVSWPLRRCVLYFFVDVISFLEVSVHMHGILGVPSVYTSRHNLLVLRQRVRDDGESFASFRRTFIALETVRVGEFSV
jgi:hypothetical protein